MMGRFPPVVTLCDSSALATCYAGPTVCNRPRAVVLSLPNICAPNRRTRDWSQNWGDLKGSRYEAIVLVLDRAHLPEKCLLP
jgi:hypothetical protein